MAVRPRPERSESLIPMATPSPIHTSTQAPSTASTTVSPAELGMTRRRAGELGIRALSVASGAGPSCTDDDSLLKRRSIPWRTFQQESDRPVVHELDRHERPEDASPGTQPIAEMRVQGLGMLGSRCSHVARPVALATIAVEG